MSQPVSPIEGSSAVLGGFFSRFLYGFQFCFRGLKLILTHRILFFLSVLPFIFGLMILVIVFFFAFHYLPQIVEWLMSFYFSAEELISPFIYYPVLFVLGLLAIVFNIFLSYWILLILMTPILSRLAEQTLKITLESAAPPSFGLALGIKMAIFSFLKVLICMSLALILFIGTVLLPSLNLLSSFFVFTVVASDSLDYALEIYGYSLKDRLMFYKKWGLELFGMACFVGFTLLIPGIILFLMPAAIVGGTLLVKEKILIEKAKFHVA